MMYDEIRHDLIPTNLEHDTALEMLDYNVLYNQHVPGGKLNRGLSVVDSYKLLKGEELSEDEFFLHVPLLQAYFLVLDDIMDESHTTRVNAESPEIRSQVGMIAVNDGVVLRNHIPRILKKHFRGKDYYVDLLDLFNEDDYLACFGSPEVIGKIGTDIEDFKCSWLVVKALELANEEQKKLLNENYGRKDPTSVAKVKELHHTLNLQVAINHRLT
ncbi:hypothetical protein L1987_78199 [Smallanthus sonchifolius]|uniref:Uncharacterized protein n=1 Tax=Smallanthus sonchifolius TaxID=185202 RepID=A0ACB8ZD19_9ASTR|nr:hypothetical protein L1987_78199 [Smallanthus sonchifolius]